MSDDWSIVFYLEDNGDSPVEEFLSGLDANAQARFDWSLDQLRVRNVHTREPLVKHISGKLWELREESRTNIYRVLYVFYTGRKIVLLHGFQKKTQKTPAKEIAVALRRLQHFVEREGGET
jgi:phage-related protein